MKKRLLRAIGIVIGLTIAHALLCVHVAKIQYTAENMWLSWIFIIGAGIVIFWRWGK